VHVECKNKSDTSNYKSQLEPSHIIQKIPDQQTGRIRNQGTAEYSHIGHCTHTAEGADVKVQTFNKGNNFTCSLNCK